ncbi:hypothetical protein LguiA_004885 [Lonicera macranthoides]
MAKSFLSLPILSLFIALFFNSGGTLSLAHEQAHEQKAWYLVKPSTSDEALYNIINNACDHVDCGAVKKGGSCFYPYTLLNHASVVMNIYYQNQGRKYGKCNFTDHALISLTDPSYGDCKYEYVH